MTGGLLVTIGGSIALIVIGAILWHAVNWSSAHMNVPFIGLILMVGGGSGLIISLVFLMRRRRPGAFLPDRFCLRAGQLDVHRVLEGIELPVGVQRRRCS